MSVVENERYNEYVSQIIRTFGYAEKTALDLVKTRLVCKLSFTIDFDVDCPPVVKYDVTETFIEF